MERAEWKDPHCGQAAVSFRSRQRAAAASDVEEDAAGQQNAAAGDRGDDVAVDARRKQDLDDDEEELVGVGDDESDIGGDSSAGSAANPAEEGSLTASEWTSRAATPATAAATTPQRGAATPPLLAAVPSETELHDGHADDGEQQHHDEASCDSPADAGTLRTSSRTATPDEAANVEVAEHFATVSPGTTAVAPMAASREERSPFDETDGSRGDGGDVRTGRCRGAAAPSMSAFDVLAAVDATLDYAPALFHERSGVVLASSSRGAVGDHAASDGYGDDGGEDDSDTASSTTRSPARRHADCLVLRVTQHCEEVDTAAAEQAAFAEDTIAGVRDETRATLSIEECTAYGLYVAAGGDPDDPRCRVAGSSLWEAIESHVFESTTQASMSRSERRGFVRLWKTCVARASADHGASFEAWAEALSRMDVNVGTKSVAAGKGKASSDPLPNAGRPVSPEPQISLTVAALVAFSAAPLSSARTTNLATSDAVANALEVSLRHSKYIRARFHAQHVHDDGRCTFPPELAHLLRLNAKRLSALVVRYHIVGVWGRALKRAAELIAAAQADVPRRSSVSGLGATTATDAPTKNPNPDDVGEDISLNPHRASVPRRRRRNRRTSGSQSSPQKQEEPTSRAFSGQQAATTARYRADQQSAARDGSRRSQPRSARTQDTHAVHHVPKPPPPNGSDGGARRQQQTAKKTKGTPPHQNVDETHSDQSPRSGRRPASTARPRYLPEPDESDFVAHLHRRAVRAGLM